MSLDDLLRTAETKERLLVCSDVLMEAGEPQGELMAAQLEGRPAAELQASLEALVARVLGDETGDDARISFEWRDGFVTALRWSQWRGFDFVANSYLELATLLDTPPELVPAMRWSPSLTVVDRVRAWRLLCRLETLQLAPWSSQPDYDQWWNVLSSLGLPSSVRRLVCDDVTTPWSDEHQLTWVELGDLSAVWPRLSNLHHLRLRGSRPDFGRIDAPELRSFDLETSTLTSVQSFLDARWPRLERFSVCFHDGRYAEQQCTLDDALAVVAALPKSVRSLGLRNAPFTEDLVGALAQSPRLATLDALDLSDGVLLDGAAALKRHAAAYRHLRILDVSDTGLRVDDELRAALPNLVVSNEGRLKAHRYVSLSE